MEGATGFEETSSVLFLVSYWKVVVPLLDGSLSLELSYAKSGVRLPEEIPSSIPYELWRLGLITLFKSFSSAKQV